MLVEGGVHERTRPWYRKDRERWGAFRRQAPGIPPDERVAEYVRELGGRVHVSDWMVVQILDAISWAHGRVLGEA